MENMKLKSVLWIMREMSIQKKALLTIQIINLQTQIALNFFLKPPIILVKHLNISNILSTDTISKKTSLRISIFPIVHLHPVLTKQNTALFLMMTESGKEKKQEQQLFPMAQLIQIFRRDSKVRSLLRLLIMLEIIPMNNLQKHLLRMIFLLK